MSGTRVKAKLKKGLAKAQKAISDGNNLVELLKETVVRNPVTGDATTINKVVLKNAVFKSIDNSLIDGESIKSGDRELVADGDIELSQGDKVLAYGDTYSIVSIDKKKPSDVVIGYICQCRLTSA